MDTQFFDEFDAAADRVSQAYATGHQVPIDRAWRAFYEDHLRLDMKARVRVFREMQEFGISQDDAMQEILARIIKKFRNGDVVNYAQMRVIYSRALSTLKQQSLDRAPDMESMIHRIVNDTAMRAEDRAAVMLELDRLATQLQQSPRLQLRGRVLRMLMTGEDSRVEIAKALGVSADTVRTACLYLFRMIRERHPELRDYLDTAAHHTH